MVPYLPQLSNLQKCLFSTRYSPHSTFERVECFEPIADPTTYIRVQKTIKRRNQTRTSKSRVITTVLGKPGRKTHALSFNINNNKVYPFPSVTVVLSMRGNPLEKCKF